METKSTAFSRISDQKQDLKIVSVEGNIGVGKSTFIARLVEQNPNVYEYLPEPINEQEIYEYYNGLISPFDFQIRILHRRVKQLNSISGSDKIILTERCCESDALIFVEKCKDDKKISDKEYEVYLRDYMRIQKMNVVYLYLFANPKACLNRVAVRKRAGEDKLSLEYLEDIDARYTNFFKKRCYLGVLSKTIDNFPLFRTINDYLTKPNLFTRL